VVSKNRRSTKKNTYAFLVSAMTLLFLSSCSTDVNNPPEVVIIKRLNPYHTVSEGDTVGSIAAKHKMTRADLIKLNKLEPPYRLYNGQKLLVNLKPEESGSRYEEDTKGDHPQQDKQDPDKSNKESQEDIATIDDVKGVPQNTYIATDTEQTIEYIWPIEDAKNKITHRFGEDDVDGGIIIEASVGTPVKAIAEGDVMIAGVPSEEAAAYGITVVIKHTSKKKMSIYANLKEASVNVGQKVKKGNIIGKVGKSGTIAKQPQLYFEINDLSGKGRRPIDPEKFLSP
jgi:lipoprotein NlpD